MHRQGRIWTCACLIAMLCAPVAMSFALSATPSAAGLFRGVLNVCLIYIPVCIVEVLTYSPMLGTGATYLAFVTGNLGNLKIPCAMNAHELSGVEFGTPENEVVSTLSVATSSLVTTIVVAAGALMIAPLGPLLASATIQPAFDVILPALFGAMGYTYFKKAPTVGALPVLMSVAVCLFFPALGAQVGFLTPVLAAVSIGWAWFLKKKDLA
jgi:hypothetical protein